MPLWEAGRKLGVRRGRRRRGEGAKERPVNGRGAGERGSLCRSRVTRPVMRLQGQSDTSNWQGCALALRGAGGWGAGGGQGWGKQKSPGAGVAMLHALSGSHSRRGRGKGLPLPPTSVSGLSDPLTCVAAVRLELKGPPQ